MAIPSYDFLDRPYDDEKMTWDYEDNRYVPLVSAIQAYAYTSLLRDWHTVENAQSYLELMSRVLIETILATKDVKYRLKTLYYISHSKEARALIFQLFCDTVWYNRRDGGFMMAYATGANLNQGKLIEFGIDKALSPIAKQLIQNTVLGTRILPIDINYNQKFATLSSLLDYLVAQSYITSEQSAVVLESEDLNDLPYHETYSVTLLDSSEYLFKNLNTLQEAIEDMVKYKGATGTW